MQADAAQQNTVCARGCTPSALCQDISVLQQVPTKLLKLTSCDGRIMLLELLRFRSHVKVWTQTAVSLQLIILESATIYVSCSSLPRIVRHKQTGDLPYIAMHLTTNHMTTTYVGQNYTLRQFLQLTRT